MFRKQGIDISSRGSFELPARLRIIVRVLSRNGTPSASGSPLPPHPVIFLLLRSHFSASCTSRLPLPSFPSHCPRPFPGYRSIYPVGPSLYFVHSSKMQPKGYVLQTDFSLTCFPRDYSLQSIPSDFYEQPSPSFLSSVLVVYRCDQFDVTTFPILRNIRNTHS